MIDQICMSDKEIALTLLFGWQASERRRLRLRYGLYFAILLLGCKQVTFLYSTGSVYFASI